jgi:phosphate transport system permease protein
MKARFDRAARRKLFSHVMTVLTGATVVIVLIPLFSILYETIVLGGTAAFTPGFFTQNIPLSCSPRPGVTCQTGGIVYAIQGTFILLGLASLYAVPVGIGAAIFAVEYGGERAFARAISMAADILSGVPSIVIGMFIYALIFYYDFPLTFSTFSGSLALGAIMLPIVMRTSEEALRTIPHSVREAALALGISRWKTSIRIILVAALPGVLTGVLLSIARAAGEAAPLLLLDNGALHQFTGISYLSQNMPVLIYTSAVAGYQNDVNLAWGAAFILIMLVLGMSIVSRFVLNRTARKWGQTT